MAVALACVIAVSVAAALSWALSRRVDGVPAAPAPSIQGPPVPAVFTPSPAAAAEERSRSGGNTTIADVAERVLPSVVNISTTIELPVRSKRNAELPFWGGPLMPEFPFGPVPGPRDPPRRFETQGSGVVVSSDGVILTSSHVVAHATEIRITTYDRREYTAEVVGLDPETDLAVLRVRRRSVRFQPIRFGDSDRVRLGELVLAVGNPFGVGQTVTLGIVSAKGRADVGLAEYEDFIQTDAAINPGNSGGALVNLSGELVGVNTAILSESGGHQGVGLAVPSNMAALTMHSLLKHGRVIRGWLGVYPQTLTPGLAGALGLPAGRGVLVSDVVPGSPAHRAGLKRNDVVLTLDGREVDSAARFRYRVSAMGPGARIRLEYKRRSRTLKVTVALGPAETPPGYDGKRNARASDPLGGLKLGRITRTLRRRYGIPERFRHGLVVKEVMPGSGAGLNRLRRGDLIVAVNQVPVRSVERLFELFGKAQNTVLLTICRYGGTRYILVTKS